MDSTQISLLVFGLVLALTVQSSFAVHCYVCNSGISYDKGLCDDPFNEDAAKDAGLLINCDEEAERRYGGAVNMTYCRKIKQDIDGEYRVVRQCGSRIKDKCIERTGTKLVKIHYCECDPSEKGDGCNTATHQVSINFALLTIVSALLAFIFHS